MSKKVSLPLKIAPFQRIIAEPITDPVEQAAIDKMRKRIRRNDGARHGAPKKRK